MMSTALAFTIVGVAWAAAWVYVRVLDGRRTLRELQELVGRLSKSLDSTLDAVLRLSDDSKLRASDCDELRARVQELQAALGVRRLK